MFNKALNNASIGDSPALAKVVLLATGPNSAQDAIWEEAELACLEALISHEIRSKPQNRDFENIRTMVANNSPDLAEILRHVPISTEGKFKELALGGLAMKLQELRSH